MYGTLIAQQWKDDNPIQKWAKVVNSNFFKEVMYMANKYMKSCSTSLIFRKMQMKTTTRYHFTPTKMARIK